MWSKQYLSGTNLSNHCDQVGVNNGIQTDDDWGPSKYTLRSKRLFIRDQAVFTQGKAVIIRVEVGK